MLVLDCCDRRTPECRNKIFEFSAQRNRAEKLTEKGKRGTGYTLPTKKAKDGGQRKKGNEKNSQQVASLLNQPRQGQTGSTPSDREKTFIKVLKLVYRCLKTVGFL